MPGNNLPVSDFKRLKLYFQTLDSTLYPTPNDALKAVDTIDIAQWLQTEANDDQSFRIDVKFPQVCTPYQTIQTLRQFRQNENHLSLLNTILYMCTFDRRIPKDDQLVWNDPAFTPEQNSIRTTINHIAKDFYDNAIIHKLISAFSELLQHDKMRKEAVNGSFQPGTKSFENEKKFCIYRHTRKILILESLLLAFHHHPCSFENFQLLAELILDRKSLMIDDEQIKLLQLMIPYPDIAQRFIQRVERLLVLILVECLDLNRPLPLPNLMGTSDDIALFQHMLYPLDNYQLSFDYLEQMLEIYKKFRLIAIKDLFTRAGHAHVLVDDDNDEFYQLTKPMDWPILEKGFHLTDESVDVTERHHRILLHNECMQVANQSPWVVLTIALSSSLQYQSKLYSIAAVTVDSAGPDVALELPIEIRTASEIFHRNIRPTSIVDKNNHPYYNPTYFANETNGIIDMEKYTRLLSPYEYNPGLMISLTSDHFDTNNENTHYLDHYWYSPINAGNAYGYLARALQEICADFLPSPYLTEHIDMLKTIKSSTASTSSSTTKRNITQHHTDSVHHDAWQEVENELSLPEEDHSTALRTRMEEALLNAEFDVPRMYGERFIGIDLDMQTDPYRADILDDALYQRGSLIGGPVPGQVTVSNGVRLTIPHQTYAVYMDHGLDKICARLTYNYVSSILNGRLHRFERPLPSPLQPSPDEAIQYGAPIPIGKIELQNILLALKYVYQIDSSLASLAWRAPQDEKINMDLDSCILNLPGTEPSFEIAAIFNACKLLWPMININPLLDFANSLCTPRTVPHVVTYLHRYMTTLTLNIGQADEVIEQQITDANTHTNIGCTNNDDELPPQWYPNNTKTETVDKLMKNEYANHVENCVSTRLNYPANDILNNKDDQDDILLRNRLMIFHELPQIGNRRDDIVQISGDDEIGTMYNPLTIGLCQDVTFTRYGMQFTPLKYSLGYLFNASAKLAIVDAKESYRSIWGMLFLRFLYVVNTVRNHTVPLNTYRSLARGIAVQNLDDVQTLEPLFLELQNILMLFNYSFKYFMSNEWLRYTTSKAPTNNNDDNGNGNSTPENPLWPFHDIPFSEPYYGIPEFIQESLRKAYTGTSTQFSQYTRDNIILDIYNNACTVLQLLEPIVHNLAQSEASGILVNHLPMTSRVLEQQTSLQQFRSCIREPVRFAATLISTLVTQYSEIICPAILQKIRFTSGSTSTNLTTMVRTDDSMDPVQTTYHYFLDIDQVTRRYGITLPLLRLVYHLIYYIVRRRSCLDFSLAFERFDQDKGGTIDVDEFRNALQRIGLRISSTTLGALIRELDRDGDREIDYNEFVRFALRHLHHPNDASSSSTELTQSKSNASTSKPSSSLSKSLLQMGNGVENSVLKYSMLHSSSSSSSSTNGTQAVEEELTNFIQSLTLSDATQKHIEENMLRSAYELVITTLRTSTASAGHMGVQLMLQIRALRLLNLLLRSKALINGTPYGKFLAEDILSYPSDTQGSVTNSLMFIIYQLPLFVISLQNELHPTVPFSPMYYNEYLAKLSIEDRSLLHTSTVLALNIVNLLFLHTPMEWEPVSAASSTTSFGVAGGIGSKVPVAMHTTNSGNSNKNGTKGGTHSSSDNNSSIMYLEEIDATDYNAVSKANMILRYPLKLTYTDSITKSSTNQVTPVSLLFALVGYYSGEPYSNDKRGWIQPESIRSASLGTLTLLSRCMSRVLLHIDTFSPRSGGLKVASIAATAAASVVLQPSLGFNTLPHHHGGWRYQNATNDSTVVSAATSLSTAAVANGIINQISNFTQLANDRYLYELDHYLLPHGDEIRYILFGNSRDPSTALQGMLRFACTDNHTDAVRVGALRFARTLLDNQSSALAILFAADFNDKIRTRLENDPNNKDLYDKVKERNRLETKLQTFAEDKDFLNKNFTDYATDAQNLETLKQECETLARKKFNTLVRHGSPSLFSLITDVLNPSTMNNDGTDYIIDDQGSNSVLRPVLLVETLSLLIALWRSASEAGVHTYEVEKLRTTLVPSLFIRLSQIIHPSGGYSKVAELTNVSKIFNVCVSTHNQYLRGEVNPMAEENNRTEGIPKVSRFHGGLVQGSLSFFNEDTVPGLDQLYNLHALRRYAYVITARALACQLYAMDIQWYGVPDRSALPPGRTDTLLPISILQNLLEPAHVDTNDRFDSLEKRGNVLSSWAENYVGSFDSKEDGTNGTAVNQFIDDEYDNPNDFFTKISSQHNVTHLLLTGSAIDIRAYAQMAKLARQYAADDGVNLRYYSQVGSSFAFPALATYGPGPLTAKRLNQNFDITAVWGALNGTDTTKFTDDVVRKAVTEGSIKHLHNAIGPGNRVQYVRYGTEFDYDVTTLAYDLGLSDTWLHMLTNLPTNITNFKKDAISGHYKKIGESVYGCTGARKEKLDADGSILWAAALQSSLSSVMTAQTNLVRSVTGLLVTCGATRTVQVNDIVSQHLSLIPVDTADSRRIPTVQYPRLYTYGASLMFARLAIGLDGGYALGVGEDGLSDMQILHSASTLAECGSILLMKEKELILNLQLKMKRCEAYDEKTKKKQTKTKEEDALYGEDKFLIDNLTTPANNDARFLGLWNCLLSIRTCLERNQLHPSNVCTRAAVQPALKLLTTLLSSALYICTALLQTNEGIKFIDQDTDRSRLMSIILYQLAECASLALKASRDAMNPKTPQEEKDEQERLRSLREGILATNQASMVGRMNNVTNASLSSQHQDHHHHHFPRLDSDRLATLRSAADLYAAASALFVWLIQRPQLLQDFANKAENISLQELSDMHSNYNNSSVSVNNLRNGKTVRTPLDLLEPWLLNALRTAKETFDFANKQTAFLLDCHDKAWQALIQSRIQVAAHHLNIANSFGIDAHGKSSAMADALAAFNGLSTLNAATIPQPVRIEIDANATFILMSVRIASNVATLGFRDGKPTALDGAGAYAVGEVHFPEAIVQSPLFSRTEAVLAERLDAQMDKYANASRGETKLGIHPSLPTPPSSGTKTNRSTLSSSVSAATNASWTTLQKVSLANIQYVGGITKIPYYYSELQKVKMDPKIIFYSCGYGFGPSNERGYRQDAERCILHQAWTESVSLLNTVMQLPAGGVRPFALQTAIMVGNLRLRNASFIEYYRLTMHTSLTSRPVFTLGGLEENTAITHYLASMYSNRATPLPQYSRSVADLGVEENMLPHYCASAKQQWEDRTNTSLPMKNSGTSLYAITPSLVAYLVRDLVGTIGGWRSCARWKDLAYLMDVHKGPKVETSRTDDSDNEDLATSLVDEASQSNVTWEITNETARSLMGPVYENLRFKAVSKKERELENRNEWITMEYATTDTAILHCLSGCINVTFAAQKLALEGKWKEEKKKQVQKITSQLKRTTELTPADEASKYHEFVVEGMEDPKVTDPFKYAQKRIKDIKRDIKADMEVQEQYIMDLQNSKVSLTSTSTVLSSTRATNGNPKDPHDNNDDASSSSSTASLVEASIGLRDYLQTLIDRTTKARTIANEINILQIRKSHLPEADPAQRVFDQQITELQTKSLENYEWNSLTPFAHIDGLVGFEKPSMGDKEPPRPGLAHLVIAIAFALSFGVNKVDQDLAAIAGAGDPTLPSSLLDGVVQTYRELKMPHLLDQNKDGPVPPPVPSTKMRNDESQNYPYHQIIFRYHIPRVLPGDSTSLVSLVGVEEIATLLRQGIGILSYGIDTAARGARMDETYTRSLLECIVKSIGDNHLLVTMLDIIDSKDESLAEDESRMTNTNGSSNKSVISSPSTNQGSFAPTTLTRTTLGSRYGYGMNTLRYQNGKKKVTQQTGLWLDSIQFISGNVYLPSMVSRSPEFFLGGHLASMRTLLTRAILHGDYRVPSIIREPGYSFSMVQSVHPLDDDAFMDRSLINIIGNLNIRLGSFNPVSPSLPVICIDPLSYVLLGLWSTQRENDYAVDQKNSEVRNEVTEWLTKDKTTDLFNVFIRKRKSGKRSIGKVSYGGNKSPKFY